LFLESVESEINITPEYEEDFLIAMNQIRRRMEATINRFLDFARPQEPIFSWVSVAELIEEALLVIGPRAKQQETIIQVSLDGDLPMIRGDRKQLEEALLNLLVNALEAVRHRGQVTISAGRGEMPTNAGPRRCVRLEIKDTGPGITAENLAKLFDPFFTTKATGAGLGLAIVYSTIHRHGGEILVQSTVGQGTSFALLIPLETM